MKKTYEMFSGEDLIIAEHILRLRRTILVHSYIYYELNTNIISDEEWVEFANRLVALQNEYPDIAKQLLYHDDFENFDASTGFNLAYKKPNIMSTAKHLVQIHNKNNPKKNGGNLF